MTVYVEALSLVNALGEDDDAILANLAEGRAPGMEGPLVRTVDGFEAPFGHVTIDLPDTNPPSSRNNRLLRACWNLRKTEFESRLKDFEDERIAVVLGTSVRLGNADFCRRMAGNGRSFARFRIICRCQGPRLYDRDGLHELGPRHYQRSPPS